ncbi:MAG: hypothetical protein H0V49_00745 [Nocardioidaceae bacterium]|nr:hypothetical protein [Nocardioidaceae bacterium]
MAFATTFGFGRQDVWARLSGSNRLQPTVEAQGDDAGHSLLHPSGRLLTNNVLLTLLIVAAFVAWIYFWVPAELIYAERTTIAWSFDRLAPEKLGYVSPRFHTPTWRS